MSNRGKRKNRETQRYFLKSNLLLFLVSFLLGAFLSLNPIKAYADGGDFSLNFVGAAPFTYTHSTGGGAFNDGTNNETADIREELEASDYACGDLVSHMVKIDVDPGAVGNQTIQLDFSFTADTTGQSGAAYTSIDNTLINYGAVENGDDDTGNNPGTGFFGLDSGINDDFQINPVLGDSNILIGSLGSTVTFVSAGADPHDGTDLNGTLTGPAFTAGSDVLSSVQIDDLEPGETVIFRIDARLGCNGESPTGNLQASIIHGKVVEIDGQPVDSSTPANTISAGNQTVPLKQIKDLVGVVPEIDLVIEKHDSPDPLEGTAQIVDGNPVIVYPPLTYTLQVTNTHETDTATFVVVEDTLDSKTEFVSAAVITDPVPQGRSCSYDGGSHTVTCDLFNVEPGEIVDIEIVVQLPNQPVDGLSNDSDTAAVDGFCSQSDDGNLSGVPDLCNVAEVFFNFPDLNPDNNVVTEPTNAHGTIPAESQIDIIKSVDKMLIFEGEDAVYSYEVTTNNAVENVVVTDDRCSPVTFVAGDTNGNSILESDETWNYTCTLSNVTKLTPGVTCMDDGNGVEICQLINIATVVGNDVFSGNEVTDDDDAIIKIGTPAMEVTKSINLLKDCSDPDVNFMEDPNNPGEQIPDVSCVQDNDDSGSITAGDNLFYEIMVLNTGNLPLSPVTVSDDLTGTANAECSANLLAGAGCDVIVGYTVAQTDVDACLITNTASAVGGVPVGDDLMEQSQPVIVTIDPNVDVSFTKTLLINGVEYVEGSSAELAVDDEITYQFSATNNGTSSVIATLTDGLTGIINGDCPVGPQTLAPNASINCQMTYSITQDDIEAGTLTNSAQLAIEAPEGGCFEPFNLTDEVVLTINQDPKIEIIKEGEFQDENGDGFAQVGETISYTLDVTNTGNVTLTNVDVTDPVITVDCGAFDGILDPGESVQCTGSYVITQADIDAGHRENLALATGDCPDGSVDCAEDEDDDDEPLPQDPKIQIVKEGEFQDESGDGFAQVGETISYTLDVTNTGNVTLTNVDVTDPVITVDCGAFDGILDPGESVQCTGSYVITQADIDAGHRDNLALTTGDCPDGSVDCATDEDDHDEPLPQNPGIELEKTGSFQDENGDGFAQVGETISYNFTVSNIGNVTLTNVTLADTVGGVTVSGGPIATLAPGASDNTTFTGSYTLTQADVDNGSFFNTALTTGQCTAQGCPVDDPDDHTEPLPQNPGIDLEKTGSFQDENGDGFAQVGETISYNFTVTNIGNVTLTNVTLADTVGGVTVSGGPIATLAPGASDNTTFTGSYTLTQADVDNGSFFNTALTTGQCTAQGCPVDDPDDHTEPLPQNPGIELEKTGSFQDENGDGFADAGETISYNFTVSNIGNVTLTNVTLADTVGGVTVSGGPIATLAPGASDNTTFTGSYTLTQADVDNGSFFNTALTTGQCTAQGCPVDDPDDHTEPLPQNPGIELEKTGSFQDENGDGFADAGETISYNFTVSNIGNVTLTNITLADTIGGVTVSGGPIASLAPGDSDSTTFTGSYTLTQADVDNGSFYNEALTTSQCTAQGCPVDDPDDHTEPLPQNPAHDIVKTVVRTDTGEVDFDDNDGNGGISLGDVVYFEILATNTGNVTLDMVVTDDRDIILDGAVVPAGTSLEECDAVAPGGTCPVDPTNDPLIVGVEVTQDDVQAKVVKNVAFVNSDDDDDPNNPPPVPEDEDDDEVPVDCFDETGFAYLGGALSTTFIDLGLTADRWGWQLGPLEAGQTYEADLYTGAGGNDLSKGTLVGKVIIDYSDPANATVTYMLDEGFVLLNTHLNVSTEADNGPDPAAPGQFNSNDLATVNPDGSVTYQLGSFEEQALYIIAHADVIVCDHQSDGEGSGGGGKGGGKGGKKK